MMITPENSSKNTAIAFLDWEGKGRSHFSSPRSKIRSRLMFENICQGDRYLGNDHFLIPIKSLQIKVFKLSGE